MGSKAAILQVGRRHRSLCGRGPPVGVRDSVGQPRRAALRARERSPDACRSLAQVHRDRLQVRGRLRLSPETKSVGEHRPQPLLESGARQSTNNSIDLSPVPDHEQRDRLSAEPGRESWIRVDIDLHDLQVPSVMLGEVSKYGRDHPTRPAPRRPKIDHRRHGRGRLGRERVVVGVDDPGERGLAPRASRDSLRDWTHAVARIAGWAADDGHHHQGRPAELPSRTSLSSLNGLGGSIPAATRRTCVNRSTDTTRTSCSTRSTPRARTRHMTPRAPRRARLRRRRASHAACSRTRARWHTS